MEKNFDKYMKFKLKEMKIDSKDQKILDVLRLNCRFNHTEIGKMVNLSRESVSYRIKRLFERGVLLNNTLFIDFDLAGLQKYNVFIKFNDFSLDLKEKIIKHIDSIKHHYWYAFFRGDYDMNIGLIVSSTEELEYSINKIKKICGDGLNHMDILIARKVGKSHRLFEKADPHLKNYSRSSFQKYFLERKDKKKKNLDEKDKQIIRLMQNNAIMPLLEVSEKTKLSVNTVYERIKQMILSGFIVGFKSSVSSQKIGREYHIVLFDVKNTDSETEKRLESYLLDVPYGEGMTKYIGKWSYVIGTKFLDSNNVNEFLEDIRNKFRGCFRKISILSNTGEHQFKYRLFPK